MQVIERPRLFRSLLPLLLLLLAPSSQLLAQERYAVAGHEVEAFGEGLSVEGVAGDELLAAVEGRHEGSGFEAVGAEDGELGEGDALDGELLLRSVWAVVIDGVGDQVGEGVAVRSAGSGGPGGVGAVGSKLFVGESLHRDSDVARRQDVLRNSDL